MARRFRKKAGLGAVCFPPGLDGLGNDAVVEGDGYAKYCPVLLEEVFGGPPLKKKVEPELKVVPEPEEELVSEGDSEEGFEEEPEESVEEEELEPDSERPNMSWRKHRLVEYAEYLGLSVSGLNKSEILEAIESYEG